MAYDTWHMIQIINNFPYLNPAFGPGSVAESHHFVLLKLGYYIFQYSVVVSYLCHTWPLVKHEKHKFYSILYYCLQLAKCAPFKCIKNRKSFIMIEQSSVLINECDHTMKLFFKWSYDYDRTLRWTKSGECVDSNLNTSVWPLRCRNQQTCLWLATAL